MFGDFLSNASMIGTVRSDRTTVERNFPTAER